MYPSKALLPCLIFSVEVLSAAIPGRDISSKTSGDNVTPDYTYLYKKDGGSGKAAEIYTHVARAAGNDKADVSPDYTYLYKKDAAQGDDEKDVSATEHAYKRRHAGDDKADVSPDYTYLY